MANVSVVTHIWLVAFRDVGRFKPLLVLFLLILLLLIVLANALLLAVILVTPRLHRPMFVFLAALFLNELSGGCCVMAFVLDRLLRSVQAVPAALCLLQVFQIYSYVSVEFTALAVISYDRYVAICVPLQYAAIMSPGRVASLLMLIWLPPFVAVGVTTLLTASLTLCGNAIDTFFCENRSITKLSCSDATLNNIYELVIAAVTIVIPLSVILVTYFHILRVCFRGAAHTRQKALATCTPHLCSLLNYTVGISFELVRTRSHSGQFPDSLRAVLPFYHLTAQPLFNPFMYGLKLTQLRDACSAVCKRVILKWNNNQ